MAPHVPEDWNAKKEFQLDSLLLAEGWWAAVQAAGGVSPGYARLGRLQPLGGCSGGGGGARAGRGRGDKALAGRSRVAGGCRRRVRDWEPHSPSGWLVEDTISARVAPRAALAALVAAIRARGGEVR